LWGLVQWFRRSQVAIYATFGARPRARLVMQATEWSVLAAIGGIWGWALGVLASIAYGARAAQAFSAVTFHTGLTLLGASIIVVLLGLRPTGTLLNALKDR
jgi:ABC-type lipoprotein release transport system permease subunit